jgi:hypothetical protein
MLLLRTTSLAINNVEELVEFDRGNLAWRHVCSDISNFYFANGKCRNTDIKLFSGEMRNSEIKEDTTGGKIGNISEVWDLVVFGMACSYFLAERCATRMMTVRGRWWGAVAASKQPLGSRPHSSARVARVKSSYMFGIWINDPHRSNHSMGGG